MEVQAIVIAGGWWGGGGGGVANSQMRTMFHLHLSESLQRPRTHADMQDCVQACADVHVYTSSDTNTQDCLEKSNGTFGISAIASM